ncbi:hypothetical protein [Sporomusa sphaeroides]|uniref:hypothetical protein n=1 Tax=Sporomusa sphaeroides TaxID=47679 RepID=UPI002CF9D471|nr:hypothetical protein [Sporomusa sphaeroides]HML33105.1 hypothetical protein [Sporomusa sphaeroides]
MLSLVNSLPWYFWVLWGVIGIPIVLIWVLKSTKSDPVLWRVGWGLSIVTLILVAVDSIITGTGCYIEYLPVVGRISMPLVALTCTLIFIGGYQKVVHPDFDPEKRRMFFMYTYAMVGVVVFFGILFAIISAMP